MSACPGLRVAAVAAGRERRLSAFEALLNAAGFALDKVTAKTFTDERD
jgi:hypothetical protein